MSDAKSPKVFISHTHADKRIARRLVRTLTARGIHAWIDEREIRVGASLTATIKSHILNSHALLVVASEAATKSNWVAVEMDFAQQNDKPIVPFFIEAVVNHELFRDRLGVNACHAQAFEDAVDRLVHDQFSSLDLAIPALEPNTVEAGLRELAKQEPDLEPLIFSCLDSDGLPQENMDTVYKTAFHPLDEAVTMLFEIKPTKSTAWHAAYGFSIAGAGTRALRRWIAVSGDGELPLVTALGTRLEPSLLGTAIDLLGVCKIPNNHALYNFIHRNAAQLDGVQRRAVVRLITWPTRENTSRMADILGAVALENFPKEVAIQQMWCRWIRSGSFDGKPNSPSDLARELANFEKRGIVDLEPIHETLREHVRAFLRSGDKQKVANATDHIVAAADECASVLNLLLREASGVTGTAEWKEWRKRDPETAEWMRWFVHITVDEANADRNWQRAYKRADEMVAFDKLRRSTLSDADENTDEI